MRASTIICVGAFYELERLFGNQITLAVERIQVCVKVIGKVAEIDFEGKRKAVAFVDATAH